MKAEFSDERSLLLLQNFRESIARASVISVKKIFKEVADAPAPRFWVGEARAARIIGMMRKGIDPTEGMIPEKKEMYRELYRKVRMLEKEHPEMNVGDLVFTAVNSPAPRSYISWQRARQIVDKAKHIDAKHIDAKHR